MTVTVAADQHEAIRAMAYEMHTTMAAVLLAGVEAITDGTLGRDEIERRTTGGRLELKRGPKPKAQT